MDPPNHPMVIIKIPEGIVGIYIFSKWQNLHIGSLTDKLRAIVVVGQGGDERLDGNP